AEARYTELQGQYHKDIADEKLRTLINMIRERLNAGVNYERLSFLVSTAKNNRNCSEPEMKRFVVSTQLTKGPASAVSFANGAIVVSGAGTAAITADGAPEAWFDPAQSVKITFTKLGGEKSFAEGVLPLHHS